MVFRVYDSKIKCEYTAAEVPEGCKDTGKDPFDRNGNWLAAKFKTPLGNTSEGQADPATTTKANEEASE